MKATLQRDRKVDDQVVEVVSCEVLKAPLATTQALCTTVNARLDRTDISVANIEAALAQISCRSLRLVMRKQICSGAAHYKESYLLDTLLLAYEGAEDIIPGLEGPEAREETPLVSDPSAIRTLLRPGKAMEAVPSCLRWVGVLMSLYYQGVPLSRLGQWTGVHKSTVWRWIFGMVSCLYPMVQDALKGRVKASVALVDEKWIKLRGIWWYWFVAIDQGTGLPLVSYLSPTRGAFACRYMGIKLQRLGLHIKAVVTDGLASYSAMLPEVVHQLCIFHHQQGVYRWCRTHLVDKEKRASCQQEMIKIVKTEDKRTLLRRLQKLTQNADILCIGPWIKQTWQKLPCLLPAIGSRLIPRTTNEIERFFRAFNQFYKTRCGFHSFTSARRELAFFILVYLFTQQDKDQMAPIESIMPEARTMPFYRLINDPLAVLMGLEHVKLHRKMANDEMAVALAA